MGWFLKTTRRILRVPVRLREKRDEALKKQSCIVADDVHLYPPSRVENFQSDPSAISIGSHCHILGQLLVLGHGGKIRIGESCFIGEHSRLWSADSITIGSRVLISHGVNIHDTNTHSLSAANRHSHVKHIFASGQPSTLEDVPSSPS